MDLAAEPPVPSVLAAPAPHAGELGGVLGELGSYGDTAPAHEATMLRIESKTIAELTALALPIVWARQWVVRSYKSEHGAFLPARSLACVLTTLNAKSERLSLFERMHLRRWLMRIVSEVQRQAKSLDALPPAAWLDASMWRKYEKRAKEIST